MSDNEDSVNLESPVRRTRIRKLQTVYADPGTSDENASEESDIFIPETPKKKRTITKKPVSRRNSKSPTKSPSRKKLNLKETGSLSHDSEPSFEFSTDYSDNEEKVDEDEYDHSVIGDALLLLEKAEAVVYDEQQDHPLEEFPIDKSKINFDLTEKDVNENFFNAKLVGNTSGLSEDEIGFFIEYVEKYMSIKKTKKSSVYNQRSLVKNEGAAVKKRTVVHDRKINRLLPLPTEMTNYALQKFDTLKNSLESMDKEAIMMNFNPTMAFFRSRNVSKISVKGKVTTDASLMEDFAMPVILDNAAFKEVEESIISNDLDPFLKENMVPNFQKKYTQFTLELLAGRSLCFYGMGSKKEMVTDFCNHFIKKMNNEVYHKERVELCVMDGLTAPSRYNSLYADVKDMLGLDSFQLVAFEKTLHKEKKQLWGDHALRDMEVLIKFYNFCKNSDDPKTRKQADVKLVLLIHNADSEMFRKPSYKKFMSVLARIPVIKLVCTIDSVKFPVNLDKSFRDDLKLAMHPLTTLKPYAVEGTISQNDRDRFYGLFDTLFTSAKGNNTSNRKSKINKGPSVYDAKSGLNNIFASISKKNLKIFKLLMEIILERKKTVQTKQSKLYRIPFRDFLAACQQQLLASNEMNLRTALIEFTTHSLCFLADKKRLGYDLLDTAYTEVEIQYMLDNQLKDI